MTYRWLLVALLWVVALLNYIDRQVIFSVFPLLSRDLSLSNVQLGLLSTVFLWVYGFLSPISGYIADRFGRARLLAVSLLVWSAVTLATGYCQTFQQLLLARALMGISEACYLPAAVAKIAEYHTGKTRSLAMGFHQSGLYAGMVLGGAVGGWSGERFGWRAMFLVLGAIGVVYSVVLVAFFRRDRESGARQMKTDFFGSVRRLFELNGFVKMTTAFSAVSIANWLVYTWLPLYLYERFGMSLAEAGFTATFYIQSASFLGTIGGGWMADRLSGRFAGGRLYTQVGGVLLASPFLFVLGYADSRMLLVLTLVLFGIGRGFYECNTMPVLCQVAPDELRSTGFGIFNFAGCFSGGVVAALAGALKNVLGLAGAFQAAAVILCCSGLLLMSVRLTAAQPSSTFDPHAA